jgi:8-oxo-dGTP pyrophosphatase MutT (NUDIX family)
VRTNNTIPSSIPFLRSSNTKMASSSSSTTGESNNTNTNGGLPRIDRSEVVGSTKWLRLETLTYTDVAKKERKWDYATRTTKKSKDSADAVVIIPLLKRPYAKKGNNGNDDDDDDSPFDTLLVEQFRPPVGKSTLEFPAGLIDAGETPEQAALRELKEETGYVGEACKIPPTVSPLVCMSPGLCDETVRCVVVVVDLDNPYNDPNGALFEATPEEGEHIRVHRVSLKVGFQKLLDQGSSVSSPMAIQGLYLFAMGLEIGKSIK